MGGEWFLEFGGRNQLGRIPVEEAPAAAELQEGAERRHLARRRPRREPARAQGSHKRPDRQRIDQREERRLRRLRMHQAEKAAELREVDRVITDRVRRGAFRLEFSKECCNQLLHCRLQSDGGDSPICYPLRNARYGLHWERSSKKSDP